MNPDVKLLSLQELSQFLGISPSAVRFHVRKRRINPLRLGRRLLFDREMVMMDLKKISK